MFLPRHGLRMRVAFRLRRWLICRSARSADIVVTPTRAMLDELRAYVNIPESQGLVSPYGIEAPPSPASQPERENANPPAPVVKLLYVSLYSEHKNLNTLLRAMPLLNQGGAGQFLLQTTADPAWEGAAWTVTHREDSALARQPEVAAAVRFVGPLSREQTARLYLDSDVFVFPSLTESFGFPMAEAMSCGLPVVASDTPVNREVCGDAAVYFSPLDPEDLARQVRQVASDASLRQRLGTRGREKARSEFGWYRHVQRILNAASGINPKTLEACQPATL
jgi:glycosyltransferase involved in cell wall biosynthesis